MKEPPNFLKNGTVFLSGSDAKNQILEFFFFFFFFVLFCVYRADSQAFPRIGFLSFCGFFLLCVRFFFFKLFVFCRSGMRIRIPFKDFLTLW